MLAKLRQLNLAFPPDLESEFLDYYYRTVARHTRFAFLMGIGMYATFGILDAYLIPAVKVQTWLIRYGAVCPALVVSLLATYSQYFRRYGQLIMTLPVTIGGLGIVAMVIIAPSPADATYYTGLLLVLMYGYAQVKIRFVWASVCGWITSVAYEVAAVFFVHTPFPTLLNNSFFLFSSNIIGMFIAYWLEDQTRRDFIHNRELAKARDHLDQQVRERTAELTLSNEQLLLEARERELAQRALRESEAKFRNVIQLSPMGICLYELTSDGGLILSDATKEPCVTPASITSR